MSAHNDFCENWIYSETENGVTDEGPDNTPVVNSATNWTRMKSKYDDFTTIDWTKELVRDNNRRKEKQLSKNTSFSSWINYWLDSSSAWICVMIVGVLTGVVSAFVDIGDGLLSDLKFGICSSNLWLNREHCCLVSNGVNCSDWKRYTTVLGTQPNSFMFYFVDFSIYTASAVSMALLSALLVYSFAPYAAGSGIAEIKCILSGFIIKRFLGIVTFLVKTVGLILSSASGLALGKEGPSIHLACCIGNIVSRWFPKYAQNEAKKRELLSASTAAALSVAFSSPIGGVMFSLEEASYYFTFKTLWRSFFCALIAGLSVRFINPFGNTLPSLYHVQSKLHWVVPELIPFALIGVIGGLVGAAFVKLNMFICRWRKSSRIRNHPLLEVLAVTLVTTIFAYSNPFTKASSLSLIRQMFNGCKPGDDADFCYDYPNDEIGLYFQLFMAIFMKFVFTAVTAGLKLPAGLFVPNIALGAIIGRTFGLLTQDFARAYMMENDAIQICKIGENCIIPGLYAIVGAASVLCGVMRITITLAIIMFELTGSIDFVVPAMIAIVMAKWTGDAIHALGIYDAQIQLNGYPFLDNKEDQVSGTNVQDLVEEMARTNERKLTVIRDSGWSIQQIIDVLNEASYRIFPVVDEQGLCKGYLDRKELQNMIIMFSHVDSMTNVSFDPEKQRLSTVDWSNIVDRAPFTVHVLTSIEVLVEMFKKMGLRQLLVMDNGKMVEIITKKDLLRFINQQKHGS